ncbi:MAG: YbaB/EbfC family nucleoid-associated protein [bacterium]|nr:YbaB/EbfC family nucleoid-associated protein [bacterium]
MKGLGNITQLMKQAKDMQARMAQIQEELEKRQYEASSGGGMVVATVNGRQELLALRIEKEVVNPEDIGMLQDLVISAVNQALRNSRESAMEEMSKITGGMSLPGMF